MVFIPGIQVATGFTRNNAAPLDGKTQLSTADRLSLDDITQAWFGMIVYDTDLNIWKKLDGFPSSDDANWSDFGVGSIQDLTSVLTTGDTAPNKKLRVGDTFLGSDIGGTPNNLLYLSNASDPSFAMYNNAIDSGNGFGTVFRNNNNKLEFASDGRLRYTTTQPTFTGSSLVTKDFVDAFTNNFNLNFAFLGDHLQYDGTQFLSRGDIIDNSGNVSINYSNRNLQNGTYGNVFDWNNLLIGGTDWKYDADYSSLYTARSIPDVAYVQSLISGGGYIANGATTTLTGATIIDGPYDFTIQNSSNLQLGNKYSGTTNVYVSAGTSIQVEGGSGSSALTFDANASLTTNNALSFLTGNGNISNVATNGGFSFLGAGTVGNFSIDISTADVTKLARRDSLTSLGIDGKSWKQMTQVNTTTATPTAATLFTTQTNKGYTITLIATATRTGGSDGSAGDYGAYERKFRVRNLGGAVTIGSIVDVYTEEDQSTWALSATVSGLDVQAIVTGATNNNVKWSIETNVVEGTFIP